MKKLIVLLLVVALCAVAVVGCGNNTTDDRTNVNAGANATNDANTTNAANDANVANNTIDENEVGANDTNATDNTTTGGTAGPALDLKDNGPNPYVMPLEAATLQNTNYRTTLWTGKHLQLTVMSIPVGGEVGLEIHPTVDQFLRIEQGDAEVQMGDATDNLTTVQPAPVNTVVFVPQNTWHNIINKGTTEMKLYSIYAPPNHKPNTVHVTKADAEADEGDAGVGEGTLAATTAPTAGAGANLELKDYGPDRFITDITSAATRNTNYRTALWTGKNLQLTLMSIPVGGEIGLEVHPDVDQFLRIEAGDGKVQMGPAQNNLTLEKDAPTATGIFIPAGTWHNVTNSGTTDLKLYSIYVPPNHPAGTVDVDKAAADAREAAAGQN